MNRKLMVFVLLGLFWLGSAGAMAQDSETLDLMGLLVKSYDFLEAGNLIEAKSIFESILEKQPDNPVALNNLGAIYVRERDFQRALNCLERALRQAQNYKVLINRVCDVDGICLAFRPAAVEYGSHELAALIAVNLEMVKAKYAASLKGK